MADVEVTSFKAPAAAVLASAPDCVKILSPSGVVRFINDNGLRLLEADSPAEVIGKSYADLWPPAMHAVIRAALEGAARGQATRVEGLRSTLKGRLRWWEVHFHGVQGATESREIICIARDLTDRRDRESEWQATQQRLSADLAGVERKRTEFIATLAHELRNPLAPVRSGLQVLKHAANANAVVRVREIMERQVGHMVRLINDLLDVARVTSGKLILQRSSVDLRTSLAAAIESTAAIVTRKRHTLALHMPERSIALDADPDRLVQVFTNLLDNAAKYTGVGGKIEIRVEVVDGSARISVSDSGIGLASDTLETVFEMFNSVGSGARGLHEGLGIGLNLVRRLVELHGGSIVAFSQGLGRGSLFTLSLPLAERQGALPEATDVLPTGAVHPAIHILVVDDNADAAETLAMMLERDGHIIETAASGAEALEATARFRPDIVFLDIGMPDMDGYAVARAIRKMPHVGTPLLIALTGWGGKEDRARSKDAGFDEHLTKPADLQTIESMLTKINPSAPGSQARGDVP